MTQRHGLKPIPYEQLVAWPFADYVFACMKANGENQPMLERCSCSIDVIASIIPYEHYVTAETFLRMGQLTGEQGVLFRTSEPSHAAIDALRRAQAEAALSPEEEARLREILKE